MESRTATILQYFSKEDTFEWGRRDCCLWVADILKCLTGKDYAEPYRGKYTSELSFKKLLIKNKFNDLESLLVDLLGDPISTRFAKPGDPVMLEEGGEHLLGMCYGMYGLFLTDTGFTRRNLRFCKHTWKL